MFVSYGIIQCQSFNFVLFQSHLGYSVSFDFHIEFQIIFSLSSKQPAGSFVELLLHLYITTWRMDSLNNTESFNQVLFTFLISPSNILSFFRVEVLSWIFCQIMDVLMLLEIVLFGFLILFFNLLLLVYINWNKQQQPTPVILPGESHGQRGLVSLVHGVAESEDTTERLHFYFSLSFIGEGNATHSSILAWRIPGTEEPAGLPTVGSHRAGHDLRDIAAAATAAYINTGILYGDLMICNLAKSSYLFYQFVYSLGFSTYAIMSSAQKDNFTFPDLFPFSLFLSCLLTLASTFSTMLNRNDKSRQFDLFPN